MQRKGAEPWGGRRGRECDVGWLFLPGVALQLRVSGVLRNVKECDDKLKVGNGEFRTMKRQLCRIKQSYRIIFGSDLRALIEAKAL